MGKLPELPKQSQTTKTRRKMSEQVFKFELFEIETEDEIASGTIANIEVENNIDFCEKLSEFLAEYRKEE